MFVGPNGNDDDAAKAIKDWESWLAEWNGTGWRSLDLAVVDCVTLRLFVLLVSLTFCLPTADLVPSP